MNKEDIIKKLIAGGLTATLAGSAAAILAFNIGYNSGFEDGMKILPIGTEKILTSVWNEVLEDKRENCEKDSDCSFIDGKPVIQFEFIGSIKENFVKIMGDFVKNYDVKLEKLK